MTIGIVSVACLAARIAIGKGVTRTSTFACTSFGDQLGNTRLPSLGAAIFDDEIHPIDVAMLAHSLLQCFDERPRVGGAAGPRHVTDPRNPGGLRLRRNRPRRRRASK